MTPLPLTSRIARLTRTSRVIRVKLAALGAAVLVVGGVACSPASQPAAAPTSAPSAPAGASKILQPAAVPAAAPGGVAIGAPAAAPAADAAQRSAPAAGPGASTADAASPAVIAQSATTQPLDRMVIRTAQLSVEVADMESALLQARAIAARGGGWVSASNTHIEKINDQNRTVADLTIQVRTDAVDTALSDLRALGKVSSETSGSQDVTEEYVDLDSNLRNLQASESAILKLVDKATRIEDVLALQRELTNVRGQIERIQGRKRFLEHRTDMATITVGLRLPPLEPTPTIGTGAWDPAAVAQRGWQASLAMLRGVAEVLIVIAAFSWWLLPLLGVGGYVYLQRRRRSAPPTTTVPPAAIA